MEAVVKMLLPLACSWAEKQEAIILREGVELSPSLMEAAQKLGVAQPQRVRLHAVEQIPLPLHPILRAVAERTGLISSRTAGMTLRYGIFIRSDCWGDRRLVVHELAHVVQYERFGGFQPFLERYMRECLTPPGYPFGPLEQEAQQAEQKICGA